VKSREELILDVMNYAAERGISIPADVLLDIGIENTKAMLAELPIFTLTEPGLVPAPNKNGLMLMSEGWTKPVTPSATYYLGGGTTGGASVSYPILPSLGGTGIANADANTLTLGAATSITGGGTIGLGGFTLTMPATGTPALLDRANVFTVQQMVDGTADEIQLRVQANAAQTTNLITVEKSDATVIAGIQSYGALFSYGAGGVTTNTIIGLEAGLAITSGGSNLALGYGALKTVTTQENNVAIGQRALELCVGAQNVAIGSQAGAVATGADNTFIGYNSGVFVTTAKENVGVGSGTLVWNQTRGGNVAVGYQALKGVSTKSYDAANIGIGLQAGSTISTGGNNVCIGNSAGYALATAEKNIFIGTNTGGQIVGSANVAIGHQSMFSATSGASNVYIGYQAGFTNVTGNSNIFIGRAAGYRQTASGRFIIDNTERATIAIETTNSIIYGVMAALPVNQTLNLNAVTSITPGYTAAGIGNVLTLDPTGSGANGDGGSILLNGKSSTTAAQAMGKIAWSWVDATDASRKAKLNFSVYDTAVRSGMEIVANGTVAKVNIITSITTPDINFTPSTPSALGGDVNDWDLGGNTFVRSTGGAADRTVTGIVARETGHYMIVTNIGTTNKISYANESGSSSAANRIITATGGTVEVHELESIFLVYDGVSSRWREVIHA